MRFLRADVIRTALVAALMCAIALVFGALAEAKILKTRRAGPSTRQTLLTVGSGFEYETDPEESDYDYPFLVELGITRNLQLTLEPNYTVIRSKPGENGTNVSGWGDLETTLEYEFLPERRWRPSFTAETIVKWPTAAHDELGTGETDYAIGLILSKEFVRFDADFNATYTFVGDPPGLDLQNATEISASSDWHLGERIDLEGEVVYDSGGGLRGSGGSFGGVGGGAIGPSENVFEGTLGLAERLGEYLKLEEGVVGRSDGSWQLVFAWEWDFDGNQ